MVSKHPWILLVAMVWALISLHFTSIAFSQDVTEDEIKAALVFKFPGYVRWPGKALNSKTASFNCCVLGRGGISAFLQDFDGESILDKPVRVKHVADIEAVSNCHLLFVCPSEKKRLPLILEVLKGKPVLTVGDLKGFTAKGGMINFVRKKDTVHFEINLAAGERAGLKFSSKLLRVARIVDE